MRQETRVGLGRAWGMGTGTRASPSPRHQKVLGGTLDSTREVGWGLIQLLSLDCKERMTVVDIWVPCIYLLHVNFTILTFRILVIPYCYP